MKHLSAAMHHATCALISPNVINVPDGWDTKAYNANLETLGQLATKLVGHRSKMLQGIGIALMVVGAAAVIAFTLMLTVPTFSTAFAQALGQVGLYKCASDIAVSMVGVGALLAIGGSIAFFEGQSKGVARAAEQLATHKPTMK